MSTEAQIAANKSNAQHSTGPKSPEGKLISSQNNVQHGLAGEFRVLSWEDGNAYADLLLQMRSDHSPSCATEDILIERLAQHHWLRHRAIRLQNMTLEAPDRTPRDREHSLALYIRYQTTNERAFSTCLHDLLRLRAEQRKEEIGFQSQKLKKQEEDRKQSVENRKQDLHKMHVFLAEGKAEHQQLLNHLLETPEMRMPNRIERIISRTQAA